MGILSETHGAFEKSIRRTINTVNQHSFSKHGWTKLLASLRSKQLGNYWTLGCTNFFADSTIWIVGIWESGLLSFRRSSFKTVLYCLACRPPVWFCKRWCWFTRLVGSVAHAGLVSVLLRLIQQFDRRPLFPCMPQHHHNTSFLVCP